MLNLGCSKKEWYLAKTYSNLERIGNGLEGLKAKYRNMYMRPVYFILGLLGLIALLSMLSGAFSFIERMSGVFVFLTFVGLVFGVVWLKRDYEKYRQKIDELLLPPKEEELVLYTLSDEGIYINFYNIADHQYFIRWEDISDVRVTNMGIEPIYKDGELQTEKMKESLKKRFEEAKSIVGDFDYELKLVQEDMYSLRITTKQAEVVLLPIPPSWEMGEGQIADRFIKYVEKAVTGAFTEEEKSKSVVNRFLEMKIE